MRERRDKLGYVCVAVSRDEDVLYIDKHVEENVVFVVDEK